MINNKTILLFGGTGSLGYEFVKRYINNNIIYAYSRDECKHWKMKLDFNNNTNVKVVDDGVNGEQTNHMKHRISLILSKTLYDGVVVLGGTNDLGHHRSKDEILTDLYDIHSTIHNFGIKAKRTIVSFAMTIPPLGTIIIRIYIIVIITIITITIIII